MNSHLKKGFTLIELLVVISIIALLSTVILGAVNDAREKSAVTRIKEVGEQIRIALELYKSDHGTYPTYNSFQIDPWKGTSSRGTIGAYIKDITLTNQGLKSFWFRDSALYNSNAIYYYRNNPTGDNSSCANIPPGVRPPYVVIMTIDPYLFDLNKKYGFYHYTKNGVNPYYNMYCFFTPPH